MPREISIIFSTLLILALRDEALLLERHPLPTLSMSLTRLLSVECHAASRCRPRYAVAADTPTIQYEAAEKNITLIAGCRCRRYERDIADSYVTREPVTEPEDAIRTTYVYWR